MTKPYPHAAGLFGCLMLAGISYAQTPGTGRVQIKPVESYSGSKPLPKPTGIVVYNLTASPEQVQLNQSRLNRLRVQRSGNEQEQKTELANKIVNDLSDKLINELQKTGIPVTKGVAGEDPPADSLAVQGNFLVIDEGNKAKRMAVGLGAGASTVKVDIQCSLKQPAENVVLTKFEATSTSSKKPGAAETMGAGAAPEVAATVGGVTEYNQGAEGDADRMAKAIAKQIRKTMAAQGWIPASS